MKSNIVKVKGKLDWSGILKLTISNNALNLDNRGLVKNSKMHVTLVHTKCFRIPYGDKRFDKYLKKNTIQNVGQEIDIEIDLTTSTIWCEKGKRSLVYYVTEKCQKQLDLLVQNWFSLYGLSEQFNKIRPTTPDRGRRFHISYANLTGDPFDSIAVVWDNEEVKENA